MTPSLCALFNLSLTEGKLLTEWKDGLVVPVHKKGEKEDVVSKVFERYLFKHFKVFLCPLFDNAQHGFLQGRSTVTQLLPFDHSISWSLNRSPQSDIAYLHLAKAFDSVSRQKLLLKLSRHGVSRKLLRWFESYLCGRGQPWLADGFNLSLSRVPSEVPHGSIFGPVLVLVYVNDLPPVIQN